MTLEEMMTAKALEDKGLSPYEQMKIGYLQQKHHTSGIGVAGLVLGTVGTAVGVGAWLFGGMYGNAKAAQAREAAAAARDIAAVQIQASQRQLDQLMNLFAAERLERINGDTNISQTITDTISGQQSSSLTAQQQAELAASQVATQSVMAGLMTGKYSENPQKVQLYSPAQPFQCGCGCNG